MTSLAELATEARVRIAAGEDPTRLVHIVWFGDTPGYLSTSIPPTALVQAGQYETYQSLADWAGTTH